MISSEFDLENWLRAQSHEVNMVICHRLGLRCIPYAKENPESLMHMFLYIAALRAGIGYRYDEGGNPPKPTDVAGFEARFAVEAAACGQISDSINLAAIAFANNLTESMRGSHDVRNNLNRNFYSFKT